MTTLGFSALIARDCTKFAAAFRAALYEQFKVSASVIAASVTVG
jgi:hypothetical protein